MNPRTAPPDPSAHPLPTDVRSAAVKYRSKSANRLAAACPPLVRDPTRLTFSEPCFGPSSAEAPLMRRHRQGSSKLKFEHVCPFSND